MYTVTSFMPSRYQHAGMRKWNNDIIDNSRIRSPFKKYIDSLQRIEVLHLMPFVVNVVDISPLRV